MKQVQIISLLILLTGKISAQRLSEKMDSVMSAYAKIGYNAVVLAGNKDSIIYHKAIGYKNFESRSPMELNTLFKTESVGKMFTAIRILQLYELKKIAFNKPINYYLPELSIPNGDKILVHHLLNHTSGLASHWENPQFKEGINYTLQDIVKMTPVRFSNPGEGNYYSNSAYFILAGLIEKIDGKSFIESIRKNIFLPAGMTQTTPLTQNKLPADAATPYYQVSIQEFAKDSSGYTASNQLGAGGWISNANDLYKFLQALLKGKYLSPETMNIQISANGTKADTANGFRYGVMKLTNTANLSPIYGHNGGGRGFSVDMFFEKNSGSIVVMCSNLYGVGYGITRNLFYAMLKDSVATEVYPPAHVRIANYVRQHGTKALLNDPDKGFKEIGIPISERSIVNTAENFMLIKDFSAANDIMQMARQKFPSSANALLISGKIAIALQKNDEARSFFTKALELATANKDQYILEEAKKLMH